LFVIHPPLHNYPGHLARIYIEKHLLTSSFLSERYEFNTFLLPNVVMDVSCLFLTKFLSVAAAGRVFVAVTLLLILCGTLFLHYCLFARFSPWPLVSAFFLYNWLLLYSFLNYLFGIGLTLWGCGLWIRLQRHSFGWRLGVGTVLALFLFFSHLAALGLYAVIVTGYELQQAVSPVHTNGKQAYWNVAVGAAQFAAPLALLFLVSPTGDAGGMDILQQWYEELQWSFKAIALPRSVFSGSPMADAVLMAALALGIWLTVRQGRLIVAPSMWVALGLLVLLLFVAPRHLFSSGLIDVRISVGLVFVAIASTQVSVPNQNFAKILCVSMFMLLGIRNTLIVENWIESEQLITRFVQCAATLPAGSTLYAASIQPNGRIGKHDTEADLHRLLVKQLASLATLQKPIFAPAIFANRPQHPLGVTTAYQKCYDLQARNGEISLQELQEFVNNISTLHRIEFPPAPSPVFLLLLYPEALNHPMPTGTKLIFTEDQFSIYELEVSPKSGT